MINLIPNTANHTHRQVAQNSRASQNLPKSMVAPTLTEKKMKKHRHTTLSNKCHCCVAVHDIFDFVARYTDA